MGAQKPNLGLRRPGARADDAAERPRVVLPSRAAEVSQTCRKQRTARRDMSFQACAGAGGGWASSARICELVNSRKRLGWVLACMGELPRRKMGASRQSPNFLAGLRGDGEHTVITLK